MDKETEAKQRELEYEHADPYIVSLLKTARQYLDLHEKAPIRRSAEQADHEPGKFDIPSVAV
jgi:hypothetical protein